MSEAPSPVRAYALGRSDAETDRLILQNQIYGPITRRFLTGAGITAGMKVLDLGSGAGDVALILAALVGPQGKVIGVDMNQDILETARGRVEAAGWTSVEFRHGGLKSLDVGQDFDAIVGRWILMYVSQPTDLLRKAQTFLRRGGIVAFQESDLANPLRPYPPVPLHDQVKQWTTPPPGAPGPDVEMGLKHSGHLSTPDCPRRNCGSKPRWGEDPSGRVTHIWPSQFGTFCRSSKALVRSTAAKSRSTRSRTDSGTRSSNKTVSRSSPRSSGRGRAHKFDGEIP
jgi:SAM-dependent methyltransferase